MPKSCPECGAAVEFTSQTTEVLQGACSSCHHAFVLLPVQSPIENLADASAATEAAEAGEEEEAESLLPCPSCGEGLELELAGPNRLKATCEGCGAVVSFRRESDEAESEEAEAPERPMRAPPRRDDRAPELSRARPCRQCGAPLSFETNADQTVTGRCQACGNEFTLPPRRDDRGGGGGRSYGRPRGSGGYSRFPPGGRGRSGGSSYGDRRGGGRFRSDRDDREGPDRRRRRRE